MNIKSDLLSSIISDEVKWFFSGWNPDNEKLLKEIPDTVAISALGEIQEILGKEELSDFEIVEEIVEIFAKYNLNTNGCHDFG